MQLVSKLFDVFDGLSAWAVVLLIVGGLVAIAVFARIFQSDFSQD